MVNSSVKDSWNTGAEHYLQTVPRLKEAEKFLSRTKITILDLTDHLFQTLEKMGFNFFYPVDKTSAI